MKKSEPKTGDLKVWWIPQIPMKFFEIPVKDVYEGVKIMKVLAQYDLFQLKHNIKLDYSNSGGLMKFEDGEWNDWEGEYEDAYFEDPEEYLKAQGIPIPVGELKTI